ncbi:hypothetical protein H6788_00870 [Candidatus Nomurabacteria bacterium]|nr:hypothetical protein [Candidatus Nomurabacteria bacterium]MCB9819369.1 hypothetical protein [Candidatus Nomurabacteria bacterium]
MSEFVFASVGLLGRRSSFYVFRVVLPPANDQSFNDWKEYKNGSTLVVNNFISFGGFIR